jgi:hypothetical protein
MEAKEDLAMTGYRSEAIQESRNQREIGKQNRSGTGQGSGLQGGRCKVTVLLSSLLLSVSLYAQTNNSPAPQSNGEIKNSAPLKLPVAHAHFGSSCMGFLTITLDAIRYDVVRPHGKDDHSFSLKREQVLFLNYWVLAGQPMNAVEIRTATRNYHFWLMQSAQELQLPDSSWRPIQAAASDSLLLSLYYWRVTGTVPNFSAVNAALARAKLQAASAAQTAQAGASANGAANNPYDKMAQHSFVDAFSQGSIYRQMNSINSMSHW